MQLRLIAPAALTALFAAVSLSPAALAADPTGVWAKEDGSAKIEVTKCGRGLCSKIIWLRDPNDSRGSPLRDGRNENVSLRTRPIMGLSLFSRMAPAGANAWVGTVYNPEEGKAFTDVTVTLVSQRQIVLRGCKMMFCREKVWTRTSPPPAATPPAEAEEPALIEAKAEPGASEPKAEEAKAAQQRSSRANAVSEPTVEADAAYIAPGVVATEAKADPLPLSGEDVPSMMVMNKPASEVVPPDNRSVTKSAKEAPPPAPARAPDGAAEQPQVTAAKPKAPSRVANRAAAPAPTATQPDAPVRQVQQEPRERLPWERGPGYTPSYLGFDQAAPPPRGPFRGLFGGLFR